MATLFQNNTAFTNFGKSQPTPHIAKFYNKVEENEDRNCLQHNPNIYNLTSWK